MSTNNDRCCHSLIPPMMMKQKQKNSLLLLLLLTLWTIFSCANYFVLGLESVKLLQVQMVSRHCDRTTIHEDTFIPNDPFNWYDVFGLIEGQLTGLGQQQCNEMGNVLFSRYLNESSNSRIDRISTNYNQTMYHFRSTDVDRTIMSIWSVSMGLFKQGTGYQSIVNPQEPSLGYALPNGTQAIPIHTESKPLDGMLRGFELCNSVEKRKANVINTQEYKNTLVKYRTFIDELYKVTGWSRPDTDLHTLFDLLQTQYSHNVLKLQWVIDNWSTLESLRNDLLRLQYSYFVIGREGMSMFNRNLLKVLHNEKMDKYVHYSAHDSTIQAISGSLKLVNDYEQMGGHPPYGSNMGFELHLMSDGSKAVRVVYNHGYSDTRFTPLTLKSLGCPSEFCPLSTFEKVLKANSIVEDWCLVCGNNNLEVCAGKFEKGSSEVTTAFVIITPLLVVTNIITLFAFVFFYLRSRQKKYAYGSLNSSN